MLDQRKVEKIQHRATKLLLPLQDKSYTERLTWNCLHYPIDAFKGGFDFISEITVQVKLFL